MAFLYFAEKQVDCAVIEVGMGGLWDSTNIITPEVSVITNVTLEHTERLGKTIEAIAAQKAGIIKPGVPVVTEAEGKALEVIRGAAEANHAPLYVYGDDFSTEELTSSMDTQTFLYRLGEKELEVAIHLPGNTRSSTGRRPLRQRRSSGTSTGCLMRRPCSGGWRRPGGRDGWSGSTGTRTLSWTGPTIPPG
mgnify:CR=1 FL=1